MKDQYLRYVLCTFVRSGNFHGIHGGEWIDHNKLQSVFDVFVEKAFAHQGIQVKPTVIFKDDVFAISDEFSSAKAIEFEGDQYTGKWFRFNDENFGVVAANYLNTNDVALRLSRLGTDATSKALQKVVQEYNSDFLENFRKNRTKDGGNAEKAIPAADRIVTLNHNNPDYVEIAGEIERLKDYVRGINDPIVTPSDKSRIIKSLNAASVIWESASFRVIQVKIGVILAIEDAEDLISSVSPKVGVGLLVQAIKALFKNHFHIDLDQI